MPDLSRPERTRRRIWLWISILAFMWLGVAIVLGLSVPLLSDGDAVPDAIFTISDGTLWERAVVAFAAQGFWIIAALWFGTLVPTLTARRYSRGRAPAAWMLPACRALAILAGLYTLSVILVGVLSRADPARAAGLDYESSGALLGMTFAVSVPHLLVLILARLLPTGRDPGQCRACGYDLVGVESGPCPECGAPRPGSTPAPARPPLTVRRVAYALTIHALALVGIVMLLDSIWPAGRPEREAVEWKTGNEAQLKRFREARGNTGLFEHFYSARLGNDGGIFLVFDKADRLLELRMRPPGAMVEWNFAPDIDYPDRWTLEVPTREVDPQTNLIRTLSTYIDLDADGMPEHLIIGDPPTRRIDIPPLDLTEPE